ncbi:MAG TPA: TetR/AcrR family transcriptional regulator [Candidatus Avamphibacillus sp.]|nr:TetR/AcrR family transcriptional regulator [Candidatus Avamphibacillus sp.]
MNIINLKYEEAIPITEAFKNLEPTKRKRIINAALKEFAEKDFDHASTNSIVKNAGIGKGMLFYYFQNKRDLYLYLIDYCLMLNKREYLDLIDENEPDFIERLKRASRIKWKLLQDNPDVLNFLGTVFLKDDDQLSDEVRQKIEEVTQYGWEKIYKNINLSLFREDIDVEKAFKLIQWAIAGYEQEMKYRLHNQTLSSIDYEPYFKEFFGYLDVLKRSFYTKEEER